MNNKKALEALIERTSCPRLIEPAPTKEQLELLIKAALRAADHASLTPWRFVVVDGEKRNEFGEILLESAKIKNPEMGLAQQKKIRQKPLRAPMILTAICEPKEHPKVPKWEQELSTAAACQNIINASYMMGIGAYWRTGSAIFSPQVKAYFNVSETGSIIGFIYLGTPFKAMKKSMKSHNWQQFISYQ